MLIKIMGQGRFGGKGESLGHDVVMVSFGNGAIQLHCVDASTRKGERAFLTTEQARELRRALKEAIKHGRSGP